MVRRDDSCLYRNRRNWTLTQIGGEGRLTADIYSTMDERYVPMSVVLDPSPCTLVFLGLFGSKVSVPSVSGTSQPPP